jgi:hypothetical protein
MPVTNIETFDGNIVVGGDISADNNTLKIDNIQKFLGINKVPSSELDVNGTLKCDNVIVNDVTYSFIPPGGIMMWSGTIGTIPSGWSLCDGTNGTPNLADRFVRGAGPTLLPGGTGGANQVTLTVNNLYPHTHTVTQASDGAHNHYQVMGYIDDRNFSGPTGQKPPGDSRRDKGSYYIQDRSSTHDHIIAESDSRGDGLPLQTLPACYHLAYIMKL